MNSCRSIEFSACAPPLITFSIGTGSTRALVAAEVAVERDAGLGGGRLRGGERDAEDRVRAEPALVRRSVELDQSPVERGLVARRSAPTHARRELAVDVRDRLRDALAAPGGPAVAQLDGLVDAGRGARGNDGRARSHPDSRRTSTSTVGLPRESSDLPSAHVAIAAHPPLPSRGRSIGPARRGRATPSLARPPPRAARPRHPPPEALGRRAQLELRVDVQPPRDVHAREEHVAELGGERAVGLALGAPARRGARPAARRARRRDRRAHRRASG